MQNNEEVYLRSTMSFCDRCGKNELARIVARADGVFMERLCAAGGVECVLIARDPAWYRARTEAPRNISSSRNPCPSSRGCPLDCGPCQWHTGGLYLPVFSITNDCNLDCPICFTHNRPDLKYYKSVEDTQRIMAQIIERSGGVQLINLTGGEPTLHPELFAIIDACRREGIGRITMNTNGIRIASDPEFARKLKETGVQLVLSLDTLDPENSIRIHGKDISGLKKRCLEILEDLDIPTTILPVCIKGVNETEVVGIVHEYLYKPFVRSITVQNMTFTGKNGSTFQPREHITLDEVEALISTRRPISQSDFFPLSSYHPLCYSAAYFIVHDKRALSLARVLDRSLLSEMSANSYILSPDRDLSEEFRAGINNLWASGESDETLAVLRAFLGALYPADKRLTYHEQRALLEQWVKLILIHPHMDRDNFDIDRVSSCGDLVPDEHGRMIPACSYNLLYRQKDPRFWVNSQ